MQMRAITKLLGEEMTAEVGFIGGLTRLSWKPHRITQLSTDIISYVQKLPAAIFTITIIILIFL